MAVLTFFVRLKSFWRSSRGSLKRKRFEMKEILVEGKRESYGISSKKYAMAQTDSDTDTDTDRHNNERGHAGADIDTESGKK